MHAALGDALAIALLEGRGFTALDFSVLHPGGKLGAMLKFIRDLMHSGDAVPLKPLGTKCPTRWSRCRRRALAASASSMQRTYRRHRHRRRSAPPHAARSDDGHCRRGDDEESEDHRPRLLAGEALETLNSSKITTLIVADGGKPVGIVHLHDFLRAGVA